jgi:hypothetical protein
MCFPMRQPPLLPILSHQTQKKTVLYYDSLTPVPVFLFEYGRGPSIPDTVGQHDSIGKNTPDLPVLRFEHIGKGHGAGCSGEAGVRCPIRHPDNVKSAMIEAVQAPGNALFHIHQRGSPRKNAINCLERWRNFAVR